MSTGPALDYPVDRSNKAFEDRVVDNLFDEGFDWVDVVRSYPIPCLAIAAVAGFLVGRAHGAQLFDVASDALTERVVRNFESASERY